MSMHTEHNYLLQLNARMRLQYCRTYCQQTTCSKSDSHCLRHMLPPRRGNSNYVLLAENERSNDGLHSPAVLHTSCINFHTSSLLRASI